MYIKDGKEILNHLHEDVGGLKSRVRSRIWKCERDFFQYYCVAS